MRIGPQIRQRFTHAPLLAEQVVADQDQLHIGRGARGREPFRSGYFQLRVISQLGKKAGELASTISGWRRSRSRALEPASAKTSPVWESAAPRRKGGLTRHLHGALAAANCSRRPGL